MNPGVKHDVVAVQSPPVQALRLRPLREEDEAAFAAGHRAMAADGFTFGLGYEPGKPWRTYLRELGGHREGPSVPPRQGRGFVRAAEGGGGWAAGTPVRFGLTAFLVQGGGPMG